MKFVTRPAPNKLTPAPNAHKMMQRMAIDRAACVSKSGLKAHPDSFVETQKNFWIADAGDRIEQKVEYSSLCEEEGTCRPDLTSN